MECPREVRAVRRALLLPSAMVLREPTFAPDSEAFNSYIGDGFLVPELKDEREASKDEQADSSSANNVGNGALFVIGLHRAGDAILLFQQDWEVANVASSCQKALDMLCPELHDVEGGATGSASERVLFLG